VLRIGLDPDVIATMCLFCKIAAREIKADIVFEDAHTVAFRDINPQAPTHVLVIPKLHVVSLSDPADQDAESLGPVLVAARTVAAQLGLVTDGYRVVINSGRDAGQSVFHLHAHVLAGRALAWPPG
jgi:histidine triad (HIT) family protein